MGLNRQASAKWIGVALVLGLAVAARAVAAVGDLDTSFGGDGQITIQSQSSSAASDIVVQPDGKIVVAGTHAGDFVLTRVTADGSPDTSFSGDGKLTIDFTEQVVGSATLALQADGKILVVGSDAHDCPGGI